MKSSVDLEADLPQRRRPRGRRQRSRRARSTRSTVIPVHVPGIGLVEWSRAQIDAHAELTGRTHRPDESPLALRLRWSPLPIPWAERRRPCCTACALDWPCPEVRWARDWLGARSRFLRLSPQRFA